MQGQRKPAVAVSAPGPMPWVKWEPEEVGAWVNLDTQGFSEIEQTKQKSTACACTGKKTVT